MDLPDTSPERGRAPDSSRAQGTNGSHAPRPFGRSVTLSVRQIVKARAKAAGISLNEVERRAHWSTGTLSRVLRANMTLASLERIAAALGCPAWELLRDAAAAAPAAHERP